MNFHTVREARQWASLFLEKHHREKQVADFLLIHHLQWNRARLLADLREPFPPERADDFVRDVQAHAIDGVPLQHLTGKESFYGRIFKVNDQVLIPRPETEELVEIVLKQIDGINQPLTVVDVGTGSGVIAITLKKERPDLDVLATDISEGALQVARKNASLHQAGVCFYQGNYLKPLIDKNIRADVVISNPPYIPLHQKDQLSEVVKNYDPSLALFGGEDGLDAYREIIRQLSAVKKKKICLAFEIGYDQGEAVAGMIKGSFPESSPVIEKDMNGKDRIVYSWIG